MTNPTQPAEGMPERWQLVPVELTEEMHVAAVRTIIRCTGNDDFPPRVWRAMLAAAPKAPPMPDKVRRAIKELWKGAGSNVLINEISVLLLWLKAQGFTKE